MGMGYALALLITLVVAAPVLWAAWWFVAALADRFNPTYGPGRAKPRPPAVG